MRPNVKIYKHIPLEREIRSLAKHGEGGRMEEFRGFHGEWWIGREFGEGDGKKRENGEKEDEDEVEVKECDK